MKYLFKKGKIYRKEDYEKLLFKYNEIEIKLNLGKTMDMVRTMSDDIYLENIANKDVENILIEMLNEKRKKMLECDTSDDEGGDTDNDYY